MMAVMIRTTAARTTGIGLRLWGGVGPGAVKAGSSVKTGAGVTD